MTTFDTPCECCGYPVGSVEHFDRGRYPRGSILCKGCYQERVLQDRAPGDLDFVCSRRDGIETSPDGMTDTTLTVEGVTQSKAFGAAVWAWKTPPPEALRPHVYWREDHLEEEGEGDGDGHGEGRQSAG